MSYAKILKKSDAELKASKTGANKVANQNASSAKAQAVGTAQNATRVAYARHAQATKDLKSNDMFSETTKSKLSTNLGQGLDTARTTKATNIEAVKNARDSQKAKHTSAYYRQKASTDLNIKQKKLARSNELKQNELKTFASTISRYDSKKKANKAINALKKSKDPQKAQKIAYIEKQMADLRAQKKAEKAARSGGRGYYRRYGGYYRRSGWRNYGSGSDALELPDVKETETPTEKPKAEKVKGSKTHTNSEGHTFGGGGGKVTSKSKASYTKSVARKRSSGRRHWHL